MRVTRKRSLQSPGRGSGGCDGHFVCLLSLCVSISFSPLERMSPLHLCLMATDDVLVLVPCTQLNLLDDKDLPGWHIYLVLVNRQCGLLESWLLIAKLTQSFTELANNHLADDLMTSDKDTALIGGQCGTSHWHFIL